MDLSTVTGKSPPKIPWKFWLLALYGRVLGWFLLQNWDWSMHIRLGRNALVESEFKIFWDSRSIGAGPMEDLLWLQSNVCYCGVYICLAREI